MPRTRSRSSRIARLDSSWASASSASTAAGSLGELGAGAAQLHRDVGEPVLRAVVQVALDPAQPRVGRLDRARAASPRAGDPLGQLGAVVGREQRLGQRAAARGERARDERGERGDEDAGDRDAGEPERAEVVEQRAVGRRRRRRRRASAANAADQSAIEIVPATMPTGAEQQHVAEVAPGGAVAQPRAASGRGSGSRRGGAARAGIGAPSTSAARWRSVSAPQRQSIIVIASSGIPIVRIARLIPTASST